MQKRSGTTRSLLSDLSVTAELVHYPSNSVHPQHEHPRAQLSFLLGGGFAEQWLGEERAPVGPQHRCHPAGASHSVRFGPHGALLLSVGFRNEPAPSGIMDSWRPSSALIGEQARLMIGEPEAALDATNDLVAAASLCAGDDGRERPVPPWLRRVGEQMADDPTMEISMIAVEAGVHRVHLSRKFQQCFGLSPTQYRLYCRCSLALRRMMENREPPAIAAQSAGFADQSHWTRASRAIAGIGPGRLRRLLAA